MRHHSMVNRILTISVCGAIVIFAANISRATFPQSAATTYPPNAPYQVNLLETARDASGRTSFVYSYSFALTSAGIYAVKAEGPIGLVEKRTSHQIFVPSGLEIKVNDLASLKSTRRVSPQIMRNPADHCAFPQIAEMLQSVEEIDGYRAAKVVRLEVTEPRRTSWYSLDHSCALLRELGEWDDGAVSEKRLVQLMSREPDASLVTVPARYAETAPSGLVSGGASGPRSMDPSLSELDEDYYKHRP